MYQLRFWNLLKELKAQEIYLQLYACRDESIDKTINIILAVASSSSIAAWAIWKEFQIVWAVLIATAQVSNHEDTSISFFRISLNSCKLLISKSMLSLFIGPKNSIFTTLTPSYNIYIMIPKNFTIIRTNIL